MKQSNMDMLNGSIADKLLTFALPLAATGMLQQLFNAADVAVVGRFAGKNAMAAVGSNSPVIGLLVNGFVGIALGANVVISKFTGERNENGVSKSVHTSVLFAVVSGLLITLLGELIAPPFLRLMKCSTWRSCICACICLAFLLFFFIILSRPFSEVREIRGRH